MVLTNMKILPIMSVEIVIAHVRNVMDNMPRIAPNARHLDR